MGAFYGVTYNKELMIMLYRSKGIRRGKGISNCISVSTIPPRSGQRRSPARRKERRRRNLAWMGLIRISWIYHKERMVWIERVRT
uniref:Uncharacterized protein n=1 Tax=Picea glauca TaxID=3330 RepID=A0A101M5B7_PICGL|nr:hypothetical protein ABT39_MTgene1013 [Picea glauca]QHR87329.1 hypothetical protein Q903MT_gene1339 [Picea sitchensis]